MPHDDLAARRWFRQRLAAIGAQYPQLKTPAQQQRLDEVLPVESDTCCKQDDGKQIQHETKEQRKEEKCPPKDGSPDATR
jgi:hypothetical protein